VRTDRMFVWLMPIQWVAGLAIALWLYRAVAVACRAIDPHVWTALFLGGAITVWPLSARWNGRSGGDAADDRNRQMAMSALLIHLCGDGSRRTSISSARWRSWRFTGSAVLVTASVWLRSTALRGHVFPDVDLWAPGPAPTGRWNMSVDAFEDTFLMLSIRRR